MIKKLSRWKKDEKDSCSYKVTSSDDDDESVYSKHHYSYIKIMFSDQHIHADIVQYDKR